MLLYSPGNEAEQVYKTSTFLDEEDANNYETVVTKLDNYFVTNTIHEQDCFHQHSEMPG